MAETKPTGADSGDRRQESVFDITDLRRVELALRESQQRMADIIDFLPDATLAIDMQGIVIAWNRAMEELTGVKAVDMLGKGDYEYALAFYGKRRPMLIDLVHTPDPEIERLYTPIVRREKGILVAEMPFPNMNGKDVFLWGKAAILYDSAGNAIGAIESVRDTSEQKRIEEALRESEERYRALVDNLGEGIGKIDGENRIIFANAAADAMLGLPKGGLMGRQLEEFLTAPGLARLHAEISRRENGEKSTYVQEFIRADGQVRQIEITATPRFDATGGFAGSFAVFHDITEQKMLERSLEQERKLLRTIINSIPDYVFLKDRKSRFILVNQAHAVLFGAHDSGEIVGKTDYDLVPRELADAYRADDRRVIEEALSLVNIEERVLSANGSVKWLLTTKVPILDANGAVTGLVGIGRDITKRKLAEEALHESEERYHLLLDTLSEGVWAIDANENTTFVNPRMAQMLGYTEDEMMGKNISLFLSQEYVEEVRRELRQGGQKSMKKDGVRHRRKDGTFILAAGRMTAILGPNDEYLGAIASVTDITEKEAAKAAVERLQEQLVQARKMEAIGRLAGGVAHDFNNLLTTILGNAELIKIAEDIPGPERELVEEIEKAGKRAAGLTNQLLAFGRKQMLQPKLIDLNVLVENLSEMLRRLIREDVALELALAPDLGTIRADPVQVEQIIINLTVNARDAMPTGGRLAFSTRNVSLDGTETEALSDAPPGPYVVVEVSDTGTGMSPEIKDHLFEPFFTTKEMGKGTGLGLSTVYGIVRQSGGYIQVDSELGKGSSFRIYFPRVQKESSAPEAPLKRQASRGGSETILLVEDEETLLRMTTRILQSLGYTVLGCRTPAQALELEAGGNVERIDLLITDVVLPGMNGVRLMESVRGRRADLKVLFISGYSEGALLSSQIAASAAPFLSKPFSRDELAAKVRESLDGRKDGQ